MRFRLWAQIGATLLVNLLILATLAVALLFQQSRNGEDSLLLAPARDHIREIGRMVEDAFPGKPEPERTAWLANLEKQYGVRLAVFDDQGLEVGGGPLQVPTLVRSRLGSSPGENRPEENQPGENQRGENQRGERPPRASPPVFFVKDDAKSQYWMGYHFPLFLRPDAPPARYTLVLIAPTALGIPVFIDWKPWLAGAFGALVVTLACWVPIVRRVTGSLGAIERASRQIAAGNFDVAIPLRGDDELADLAESVRTMAGHLSQLVHGQRRFLADIAHELCAPLARIQLSAGILEQRATAGEREHVERLERDVAHMSALVGDLLSFTKGTVRRAELGPVAVAQLLDRVLAQERPVGVCVEVAVQEGLTVTADKEYLQRAVANVLRNAIRYAGDAGPIQMRGESAGSIARLTIEDRGPGLPEGDLGAIFQPFHRPDSPRTPGLGGAGLGLAIVKGCVEACGGAVSCRNLTPAGLEVVIELQQAAGRTRFT